MGIGELPDSFFVGEYAKLNITLKQLQVITLRYGNYVYYNGVTYILKHRRLCPGVYELTKEQR